MEDYNYEEDYSSASEAESVHETVSNNDEEEDEVVQDLSDHTDNYLDYLQNIPQNKKKTILTGSDRKTRPILSKFELVLAVSRVAQQINSGAKLPKITEGSIVNQDTDVFFLAYRSVMATVRKSLDEPLKNPEDLAKCASVLIHRDVGRDFVEVWKLHELIHLEALPFSEMSEEAKLEYFMDPSQIQQREFVSKKNESTRTSR